METDEQIADGRGIGHLLVVDDNPGDARLIEEAFRGSESDPTIHTVETGEQALDFVHRRGPYDEAPRPDIVMVDWSLSKTSGSEILAELETLFPDVPVVVMSGSRHLTNDIESNLDRADAYLTKPTDPAGYLGVLRSFE